MPRFLLARFAARRTRKSAYTYTFDKISDNTFLASISDIMVERDFNTLKVQEETVSVEGALSQLETTAAVLLGRVIEEESLGWLTAEEVGSLALFTAVQMVRTPAYRQRFVDMTGRMHERIQAIADAEGFDVDSTVATEDDAKAVSFTALVEAAVPYSDLLTRKHMLLLKAPAGAEFFLGDSGVGLHNDRRFGPYGNLGLAMPGIQVTLPISPKLALAFWCPSILTDQRERATAFLRFSEWLRKATPEERESAPNDLLERHDEYLAEAERTQEAIANAEIGAPVLVSADNVIHLNSQQVRFAERYVVSKSGDFGLVTRMIEDNGKFRSGMRVTMD